MKVNLSDMRRRWLVHLFTVILSSLVIPTGLAGVIVDVPAESSANTTHEESLLSQNKIPIANRYGSVAKLLYSGYTSNEIIAQGIDTLFKVPKLSESCSRDVYRFAGQLKTLFGIFQKENSETKVENWALQMLDAWAKPPEGILSGHVNALGDFDECLAIRAPSKQNNTINQFQGKYCLVYTVPNANKSASSSAATKIENGERSVENLMKILTIVGNAEIPLVPSIGSCLPSTCSDQEILEIVRVLFATIDLVPVSTFCSVDEPQQISTGAIATISLLVVLAFLVLVGTLVELAINHDYIDHTFKQTKLSSVSYAFSLVSNGRKFLNTETNPNDVTCLHGIRFLSASWVVLGHTYFMGVMQPLWNIVDTYSMITTSLSMVVIVNAAIVVDVFFVIGGFLVSLTLLVMLEKSKGKLNVPLLYIHRYLRITPLYIVIICVGTFVFPLLGNGPYWHVAKVWAGFCEKNWWKNILYINNLPIYNTLEDPADGPCHGIAWYLGVDMQLFVLSPFLLFPVWKWNRFGSIPLVLLTLLSIIIPGVLTYVNGYAPTSIPFGNRQNKYSQEAYTPTYMRATPYLIGMCTGIIYNAIRKSSFKLPRSFVVGAWILAFAAGFGVLLAPQKFLNPEYDFQPEESAIFVAGHRTAWSLAVCWLIFACGTGYGGWINQILSWKPFVPLGRLTFAIYLVSMHLQFLFHLQYRQPIYFTNYHMVNLFFGHLVMSCFIALVCTLLVEAPFMQLLKLIMQGGGKAITTNQSNDSNNNCDADQDIVRNQHERCAVSPAPSSSSSRSDSSEQVRSGYGNPSIASSQIQLITVD